LKILLAGFQTNNVFATTVFLGCLLFAFFGMTRLVFAIVDGRPRAAARAIGKQLRETPGVIVPPLLFLALSLWLGLATPPLLREAWIAAAKILFPTP
jgi:hydrogenase-4 component F